MNRLSAYSTLERLGAVITTGEASSALRISSSSASRVLAGLEAQGRARRLRSGVWAIGPEAPDPFAVVADLTRPHPSYVSFTSALNYHGVIDQIPREITVASLDRARRIETSVGTFTVHHVPPELFGGWAETPRGPVATPEKAIFDVCYTSAVHAGRPQRIPELDLNPDFRRDELDRWLSRIGNPRIRTLTRRGVAYALARAVP